MAIYFVGFRARPSGQLQEAAATGGAYVNCWISAESANKAQKIGSAFIASQGWVVESVEQEPRLIVKPEEESKEHFKQAQIDGACYVFHGWPFGDHSEESLH